MTVSRRKIVTCVAVLLVLILLPVIAWRWVFPPMPDEQDAIALYTAHEQEFATLTKIFEKNCAGKVPPEAIAVANRIKPHMDLYCHYTGTVRLILGVRGFLLTIGPEQIIGLIYIPGDAAREGRIVPVLAPHTQEVGSLYLRHVDGRWYVFYQNSD